MTDDVVAPNTRNGVRSCGYGSLMEPFLIVSIVEIIIKDSSDILRHRRALNGRPLPLKF